MGTLTTKALGPLTTFTPADECSTLFLFTGLDRAGAWGYTCTLATNFGGDHPAGTPGTECYPYAWVSEYYESTAKFKQPVYSPGSVCPKGWITACTIERREGLPPPPTESASYSENSLWSNLKDGQTAVACCPQGYSCDPEHFRSCISQGKVGDEVTGYYPVENCKPTTRTLTIKADDPFRADRILMIRDNDGGLPRETGSGSSDDGDAKLESSDNGSSGRSPGLHQTRQFVALIISVPLAAIIIGLGIFFCVKKRNHWRQRDHDAPPSHPNGPVLKPELEFQVEETAKEGQIEAPTARREVSTVLSNLRVVAGPLDNTARASAWHESGTSTALLSVTSTSSEYPYLPPPGPRTRLFPALTAPPEQGTHFKCPAPNSLMELFQGSTPYHSLSRDEIRIVKVLPGAFDDPIFCELEHAFLAPDRGYEALSYVWGCPNITSPISLNGHQYQVTSNLESALRHLRLEDDTRFLWIDALCINQLDLGERSQQIQLMKDIYMQAAGVIVWLGDYLPQSKEKVDAAFRLAARIARFMLHEQFPGYLSNEFISANLSTLDDLSDVAQRPWFTRVWVIQEVAVCRKPVFVCGGSTISFLELAVPTMLLAASRNANGGRGRPLSQSSHGMTTGHGMTLIFEFMRLRNELLAGDMNLNLAEQLSLLLSRAALVFEATNERDKIYALLGLLSYSTLPAFLRPNYTYSPERIFKDYAVYILQETNNLDILNCCSPPRALLPSWVPDWSRGAGAENFELGKVSHLRLLCENSKIEVDCLILSRIKKLVPPVDIPDLFATFEYHEFELHEFISKAVGPMVEVLNVVLDCERELFGRPALSASLSEPRLRKWVNSLTAGFRANNASLFGSFSTETLYRMLMGGGLRGDFAAVECLFRFCALLRKRLQAATYEDDLGEFSRPRDNDVLPKVGDVVCFLKGSRFKYILRPEDDEWQLIGIADGLFDTTNEGRESEMLTKHREFWDRNVNETKRIIIH